MFDLMAVAYEADLTRVFTFMMAREASMKTYPEVGITEPHHTISHHREKPDVKMAHASLNAYHMSMFAKFVGKLKATPDGDGTLLDHSMVFYGSGMSNANVHGPYPLPLVVGGRLAGQGTPAHRDRRSTRRSATSGWVSATCSGCPEHVYGESTGRIALRAAAYASVAEGRPCADTSASRRGRRCDVAAIAAPARRRYAARSPRSRTRTRQAARALLKQRAPVHAGGARRHDAAALGGARRTISSWCRRCCGPGATNAANRYGTTPLELAAENGNPRVIEALLQAGADAKGATAEGETVLMTASRTGNVEAMRMLLARGADPNAQEKLVRRDGADVGGGGEPCARGAAAARGRRQGRPGRQEDGVRRARSAARPRCRSGR